MQVIVLNIPVSTSPINPLGEVTHLIKLITREPRVLNYSEMESTCPVYFTRCKDGSWNSITEDFAAHFALGEIFKNAEKSLPEAEDDKARRAIAAL